VVEAEWVENSDGAAGPHIDRPEVQSYFVVVSHDWIVIDVMAVMNQVIIPKQKTPTRPSWR
jgi:hypothetical protein